MRRVGIIDYGQGNIFSIGKAIQKLQTEFVISENVEELSSCSHIVLPGVGAFPSAMRKLKERNLDKFIVDISDEKPIMGICLGAQLLFSSSTELGLNQGLGVINGDVVSFNSNNVSKLMNVGWRRTYVNSKRSDLALYKEQIDKQEFYYVHKFHIENCDKSTVQYLSRNQDYEFVSAVEYKNVIACQFHPEKSREQGLNLIHKFITK
jgi:imidazole glycerol-phosphate synthase subunit HisH